MTVDRETTPLGAVMNWLNGLIKDAEASKDTALAPPAIITPNGPTLLDLVKSGEMEVFTAPSAEPALTLENSGARIKGMKGGSLRPTLVLDKPKIDNSDLDLAGMGIRVIHFYNPYGSPMGGLTVAYGSPTSAPVGITRHAIMEVATAICHSKDQFSKKIGTRLAVTNFVNGKTIHLPIFRHSNEVDTLKSIFRDVPYNY